ncbi:MAG: tyrosine-type recombinase/integrase [Acidimicrobiia bacterium]
MRRSELLSLQWDDVDLDQARISVNRGFVSVGYELHVSRGKTSNSRRAIDLDPTIVAILSAWKEWQASERGAVGIEPTGWVFADRVQFERVRSARDLRRRSCSRPKR